MRFSKIANAVVRDPKAKQLFDRMNSRNRQTIDRLFAGLLFAEWLFAIGCAMVLSPRTWEGTQSQIHVHVWAAIFLGGAIVSVPIALGIFRSGQTSTRHIIAAGQILLSALLIHLTGGRIETHFHLFGSLAFLAFYRDWKVLITATLITAADHYLRGVYWPQSAYGVLAVGPWRWLEHAGWVIFEDIFLVYSCVRGQNEMLEIATNQAGLETVNDRIEETVRIRTIELEEAQRRLIQSQKMEAVGQLSAGIAHDFNNVLGGIMAYTSMLKADHQDNPALAKPLQSIETAAERGAELVKKLLAFGRKGNYERITIDLRTVIKEACDLIEPMLAGKIQLLTESPDDLWPIEGDYNQVFQCVLNLGVNARDAMPDGGTLKFHARNFIEPASGAQSVVLLVSDTGQGISAEIREKIFDPFFSTKEVGKGTGLGLSVVYGIVQNHRGQVSVESEEGKGATFRLVFPKCSGHAGETVQALNTAVVPSKAPVSTEARRVQLKGVRILLADDDMIMLESARNMLLSRGAEVVVAHDGAEALALYKERWQFFDAVVLDVTMPRLDGIQAYLEMTKINPKLFAVLASGYTESEVIAELRRERGLRFVEKPYKPQTMVDELLKVAA